MDSRYNSSWGMKAFSSSKEEVDHLNNSKRMRAQGIRPHFDTQASRYLIPKPQFSSSPNGNSQQFSSYENPDQFSPIENRHRLSPYENSRRILQSSPPVLASDGSHHKISVDVRLKSKGQESQVKVSFQENPTESKDGVKFPKKTSSFEIIRHSPIKRKFNEDMCQDSGFFGETIRSRPRCILPARRLFLYEAAEIMETD